MVDLPTSGCNSPGKVFPCPLAQLVSASTEGLLWFLGLKSAREGSGEGKEVETAGRSMQILVGDASARK